MEIQSFKKVVKNYDVNSMDYSFHMNRIIGYLSSSRMYQIDIVSQYTAVSDISHSLIRGPDMGEI